MIRKINKSDEKYFKEVPNNQKAIFFPQCLRSRECKAKTGDKGIECVNCGKCLPRCPYDIDIPRQLKSAHRALAG